MNATLKIVSGTILALSALWLTAYVCNGVLPSTHWAQVPAVLTGLSFIICGIVLFGHGAEEHTNGVEQARKEMLGARQAVEFKMRQAQNEFIGRMGAPFDEDLEKGRARARCSHPEDAYTRLDAVGKEDKPC